MTKAIPEKFADAESMLHDLAAAEVGYNDFGDEYYLTGLRVLLNSIDNDIELDEVHRERVFGMVPAVGLFKEVRIQFSMVYDMRDYGLTAELLGASPLPAMITGTVGFDQFAATFESLRGPIMQAKVMLDPWS